MNSTALWTILNIVLLVVVVPVVVLLLRDVVRPATEIKQTAVALAEAGPVLSRHLDHVIDFAQTQQLVHQTVGGLARYGAVLDRLL